MNTYIYIHTDMHAHIYSSSGLGEAGFLLVNLQIIIILFHDENKEL